MKKKPSRMPFPQDIARKIMARAKRGERAVVIVMTGGKPSKVYSLQGYRRAQAVPGKHKPWLKRAGADAVPDPLGAVPGTVLQPLTRENMYED